MQEENAKESPAPSAGTFTVPEDEIFLFVRCNVQKQDFQIFYRDPITGRGLADMAIDFFSTHFTQGLVTQQQPVRKLITPATSVVAELIRR